MTDALQSGRTHIMNINPALPAAITRETRGAIAILTLSRPAQRNALSLQSLRALSAAFAEIARDRAIRAVVIAAQGPAFCSGHDLREMTARRADADGGRAFFAETMQACSAMMAAIPALPQPVIAAVEGIATAAGCQLVGMCDLAVAGEAARFCTPGVNLGLFCSTPAVALSRNVARKHAMEMLLTGDMTGAQEAMRIGLVNRVVPQGEALAAALALAERIASKSSEAIALGKRAFHAQIEMGLASAYDHAGKVMVENMLMADAREGIDAFLTRREPRWQDR